MTADRPKTALAIDGKRFELETAVTEDDFIRGLMFRKRLPKRHGMLFRFVPARSVSFWMKNCEMPLDMIFIEGDTVRNVVHSAPPCTQDPCPTYDSKYAVDKVVELSGGSAKKYDIKPGSKVRLLGGDLGPGFDALDLPARK